MEPDAVKNVGVIGAGRIAGPVIEFLQSSQDWTLERVLVRSGRPIPLATTEPAEFFSGGLDLVIDAAGPGALAAHGERALAVCDLWSIGAAALVDDDLRRRLVEAGQRSGTRLRLLSGAIAGLDGMAAAAEAGATLSVHVRHPAGQARGAGSGTLRQVAGRFPDEVNFAVAAALAGPGIEATRVEMSAEDAAHRLAIEAECGFGRVRCQSEFAQPAAWSLHPVSASIIAALRREKRVIWAG